MKTLVLLAAICAALSGCADTPVPADTRSFDWLTGCWRQDRDNGYYEEVWLKPVADGSLGASREVRGGRTMSHEFMRLELRADGTLAYIASPSGQDATEFKGIEHSPGKLVFENPQHDYPTRIEYRYVDLNALLARIEGPGGAHPVEYPLRRVDCGG